MINFIQKKILFILFFIYFYVLPFFTKAQEFSLVPCGRKGQAACGFYDLIELVNRILYFVFVYLAVPLAAILFAWAGILLLTSGGNSGAKERAKKIFFDVVLGLFIAGVAWLGVSTFLDVVGYTGENFLE